ncbi:ABC transporter, ATP-binding domain protein, partial [Bordetella bronchiseptica D993]|uniref:TonB-dependent receptor domain-containing protein n=1 Tax=Bordetella bronchiseptica TaxID=518 RepID=UPI000460EDD4
MTMLQTENLCKAFGSVVVTRNVSLSVRAGERHIIIGPNGAGKTSLVHQLTGQLKPSSGRILFKGRDITGAAPDAICQMGVGRTFQKNNLFMNLSVRVLGGLTWLDAKQLSTGNAATDGKRVIGVPRFQANLGVEWDIPGVQGLTVDGRVVYTGSSYADAANTLEVPGWTRLDAGLRYMTDIGGHLVTWRARV